jgi:fucose permease
VQNRIVVLPPQALFGLFLLSAIGGGVMAALIGPTVPALATHLHVHESDLGVMFGAGFFASTLAIPIAGRVFDLLGARLLVPLALLLQALGLLGQAMAASLPVLSAAAALAGVGTGSIIVASTLSVSMLFPARREAVLNASNACFGAGACLGPVLAQLSLVHTNDYRPAYVVTSALLALPLVPLFIALPRRQAQPRAQGSLLDGLLRVDRRMWAYAALSFFYLGTEIGFGGWIVAIMQHLADLSAVAAAPLASLYWLLLALGGIPTAVLLQRGVTPDRIIVSAAATAAAAAAALACLGAALPIAIPAVALFGLSLAPILPLNLAAAARLASAHSPDAMGSSTALVLMAGQLGGTLLPLLQGMLLTLGPRAAIAESCACSLCMLVIERASGSAR